MRRRTFLTASAATLALPSVAQAQRKRVLNFTPTGDLVVLDPIWTTNYLTHNHSYMVFDTLYGQSGYQDGFKATLQMLAGHTVEDDGKTWRLTLRDGLIFHDDEKVLARDCAASIKRWGARDVFGQALMVRTEEISAADDKTIVFRLKRPFALLPDAMGHGGPNMCAIMPQRLAETDPFKQITEVVGSGPFRFKADERVQGSLFVYQRFEGYKPREDGEASFTSGPKVVHFDRVEWHVLPDFATKAAALRTGEIDWSEYVSPDLLPILRKNNIATQIASVAGGSPCFLRPNHLYPPFDKPAVRRALIGAIDQAEFMIATQGEDASLWSVPCGFFPPASPMASDAGMSALTGKRDYAAVKKALEATGYQGEKLVLIVATEQYTKPLSDVAADVLKRVGMNVDYQAMDTGAWVQRRAPLKPPAEGGWNLLASSFGGLDFLTPASHPLLRGNGKGAWYGWPDDPKMEELREAWLNASDLAAQKRIAAEIQLQAFQSVPYWPLGLAQISTAYRRDIIGVLEGFAKFWNVRRI